MVRFLFTFCWVCEASSGPAGALACVHGCWISFWGEVHFFSMKTESFYTNLILLLKLLLKWQNPLLENDPQNPPWSPRIRRWLRDFDSLSFFFSFSMACGFSSLHTESTLGPSINVLSHLFSVSPAKGFLRLKNSIPEPSHLISWEVFSHSPSHQHC